MTMPRGFGMVVGPFFSSEWYLGGTGGGCWLPGEETEGGAGAGWALPDEVRSLRLKEVDRRTLDWASFKESL